MLRKVSRSSVGGGVRITIGNVQTENHRPWSPFMAKRNTWCVVSNVILSLLIFGLTGRTKDFMTRDHAKNWEKGVFLSQIEMIENC